MTIMSPRDQMKALTEAQRTPVLVQSLAALEGKRGRERAIARDCIGGVLRRRHPEVEAAYEKWLWQEEEPTETHTQVITRVAKEITAK